MSRDLEQRYQDLMRANAELKEEIAQLEELLAPALMPPAAWRLTPSEIGMLRVLIARPLATREMLLRGMARARSVTLDRVRDCTEVYLARLRPKLPNDIKIKTRRTMGWYLDAEDRARLRGMCSTGGVA